jgi:hypothetical protein
MTPITQRTRLAGAFIVAYARKPHSTGLVEVLTSPITEADVEHLLGGHQHVRWPF